MRAAGGRIDDVLGLSERRRKVAPLEFHGLGHDRAGRVDAALTMAVIAVCEHLAVRRDKERVPAGRRRADLVDARTWQMPRRIVGAVMLP